MLLQVSEVILIKNFSYKKMVAIPVKKEKSRPSGNSGLSSKFTCKVIQTYLSENINCHNMVVYFYLLTVKAAGKICVKTTHYSSLWFSVTRAALVSPQQVAELNPATPYILMAAPQDKCFAVNDLG